MSTPSKPIPEGHRTVTPYLTVEDTAKAIEFYRKAFNATELMRFEMPDGRIGHAEIRIGDSIIMLSDAFPEMGCVLPLAEGTPVSLYLYIEDVDRMFDQAIKAGAKQEMAVRDQFYGDRSGSLIDPFGHRWHLATHIEDVSMEDLHKRMAAMAAESKKSVA